MEQYLIIALVVGALIILKYLVSRFDQKTASAKIANTKIAPRYQYSRKAEFLTSSEKEFFKMLSEVVADRYYIFPQVHLSTLFQNDTVGRYRKLGFQIINRRSVDYVLCDKNTLEPAYAVELDDSTHNRSSVIKRDSEVDQLFAEHNLPLVRFSNYRNLSQDDIAQHFLDVHNSAEAN